jgi:predicted nucleotide-binding protein
MTRRAQPPAQPQPTRLSRDDILAAIPKLRRRIDAIKAMDPNNVTRVTDPAVQALEISVRGLLSDVFGPDTVDYRLYSSAATIDRVPRYTNHAPSRQEIVDGLQRGKDAAIALLEEAHRALQEKLEDMPAGASSGAAPAPAAPENNHVFIVHGHDGEARAEIARFIEKAGLKPIILHEQASGGRTVIEKLEYYSDVGFAVVLLTPDDVGGQVGGEMAPRARQNVIAELFYFLGKLDRSRVCALMKDTVEIPSDIGGVVYLPMDDRGAWKTDLLRELEAASYHVDWASALR